MPNWNYDPYDHLQQLTLRVEQIETLIEKIALNQREIARAFNDLSTTVKALEHDIQTGNTGRN